MKSHSLCRPSILHHIICCCSDAAALTNGLFLTAFLAAGNPALFPLQDALLQRCFAAEQLRCVAASPDGSLVAAGGASGRVYVWQAGSGRLLRLWPAHYRVRWRHILQPDSCGNHTGEAQQRCLQHTLEIGSGGLLQFGLAHHRLGYGKCGTDSSGMVTCPTAAIEQPHKTRAHEKVFIAMSCSR